MMRQLAILYERSCNNRDILVLSYLQFLDRVKLILALFKTSDTEYGVQLVAGRLKDIAKDLKHLNSTNKASKRPYLRHIRTSCLLLYCSTALRFIEMEVTVVLRVTHFQVDVCLACMQDDVISF